MTLIFYDLEGRPIGLEEWARLAADRQIASDVVDGWRVSTIWTGLDFIGKPPMIFETMIFKSDGTPVWQERYPTRTAALAGHDQALASVKDHDVPPR